MAHPLGGVGHGQVRVARALAAAIVAAVEDGALEAATAATEGMLTNATVRTGTYCVYRPV